MPNLIVGALPPHPLGRLRQIKLKEPLPLMHPLRGAPTPRRGWGDESSVRGALAPLRGWGNDSAVRGNK